MQHDIDEYVLGSSMQSVLDSDDFHLFWVNNALNEKFSINPDNFFFFRIAFTSEEVRNRKGEEQRLAGPLSPPCEFVLEEIMRDLHESVDQSVEIDIGICIHVFSISSCELDDVGFSFRDVHREVLQQIRIGEIALGLVVVDFDSIHELFY